MISCDGVCVLLFIQSISANLCHGATSEHKTEKPLGLCGKCAIFQNYICQAWQKK